MHNFSIPITGGDGTFLGAVVVTEDITQRYHALEEVRQARDFAERSAQELARSNKDLEQFAYVSSHDLQEPLRMVTAFMQLLSDKYQDQLDATAKKYIHFAVDGAKRMQALINDLLAYSRVNSRMKELKCVDTRVVLNKALLNLHTSIAGNKIKITHVAMPAVKGDEVQLIQVFQNLIGNAIKFRGEEKPYIHIDAIKNDDKFWTFSIRDNGIGINPEYSEKIFFIFQRLHTKEKYPGTGIGLGLTKKIIERHGGKIWLDSEPGKGSTFYFTLPQYKD